MKIIEVDKSNNKFKELIKLLDGDLSKSNGDEQSEYDRYNKVGGLEVVLLALDGEKEVGCGAYQRIDTETVELKRIYVDKNYRTRGIATKLINDLEQKGKESGYSNSVLETGLKQLGAIALYKKLGYKRIKNYGPYINLSNSLCLGKELK